MAVLDFNEKRYVKDLLAKRLGVLLTKVELDVEEKAEIKLINESLKGLDKSAYISMVHEDIESQLEALDVTLSYAQYAHVERVVFDYDMSNYYEFINETIEYALENIESN